MVPVSDPLNLRIARKLEETAGILEGQGANPFRVNAYRQAARTVRALPRPVSQIVEREGEQGLKALPGIGESLARSIRLLVETGRLPMLERMRGESAPEQQLMSVPGIGRKLAERLHHDLGISNLEELETAAHDGRLATLAGLGEKRIAGIIDSLASRLGRVRRPAAPAGVPDPPVGELLDVDREYRRLAAAGKLRTIAPKRLNPGGEAWLPVLHTERSGRHYTALYSNTARAHQLGTTRDWVVLYCESGAGERQWTVITSRMGPLEGRRIVRGREEECATYYRARAAAPAG
jgi:predicted flap endonuclease-1-like 5' DNA nuclease